MQDKAAKTVINYLVVDNREDRRTAIETILNNTEGGRILCVKDGRTARDILLKNQVEFVITALSMPWMTGIEILRLIRRLPDHFDIPVLMLVAEQVEGKILFARDEGADEVLAGEVTESSLLKAIERIQQKRQGRTPEEKSLITARRFLLKRQLDEAIRHTLGIDGVATNMEAMHLLCECYYRQRNYDKALNYLRKIITNPTSRTVHLLSKVYLSENQCGDAITHLIQANRRYPYNHDLKIDLGKLYLNLEMHEQAREQFKAVLKDNPTDLNLVKMGKAYLMRGMLKEAVALLDRAKHPIPETAYIFARLALALEKAGDLAAAMRQYEKCLQLVPNEPCYMLNLSKMYLKTHKRNQAEPLLHHLHKRYPDNEKVKKILAYLETH